MKRPAPFPDLCAVVLAGGKSRRMGRNKALLVVGGKRLIEHALDQVRPLTDEVFISASNPEPYAGLDAPVVSDHFAGQGPLAGLHAGMQRSDRPLLLLLACDLPRIRTPGLRGLVESCDGYDAVIPRTSDGRSHPLCGVYRRTCFSALVANLERGVNKMTDLFGSEDGDLRVRWLDPRTTELRDEHFCNLNTPQDLAHYLKT